jgi:ABC-2 type transport system ATP-binding protein
MIIARGLNKKFGKIHAVKDLYLHVRKGEIHGLIGPEASGKSTVLLILSTLIKPNSGDAVINNISLDNGTHIRKMIGFVPKIPQFPLGYTARGLVKFLASLHGIRDENKIEIILKQTGLEAVADQTLDRYSQALKKNVAFAAALIHDPIILLLDEPMAGLDSVSQRRLRKFLLSSDKTVLMTARDLNTVEGICDSVTVLRNGSMIVEDRLTSLRQKIGKGALEIKLLEDSSIQKVIFELEKIGARPAVLGHSLFIHFDNDSEVPAIIRVAANIADITEAKPMNISIDDIYARFRPITTPEREGLVS